jgi:hypothetical protein
MLTYKALNNFMMKEGKGIGFEPMARPRESVQNSKLKKISTLFLIPSLLVREISTVNQGFAYCREHVGKISLKVYVILVLVRVHMV